MSNGIFDDMLGELLKEKPVQPRKEMSVPELITNWYNNKKIRDAKKGGE